MQVDYLTKFLTFYLLSPNVDAEANQKGIPMSIFMRLSTLAARQLVVGACAAVGVKHEVQAVAGFLSERFTDHSQRLTTALENANENAWKALEIALAGDSFWERCKGAVARGEDKAFAQQIRAFLDTSSLPELTGKDQFRQKCLEELRAARKSRTLARDTLEPRQLAKETADFARFAEPERLLDAEWRQITGMADELKEAGFPTLGWLISQRPDQGAPILVAGVRYFFRRSVEEDQQLFQGLAFAKLEALNEAQEKGFAALTTVLVNQGERLEELLGDVKAVVVKTHSAVLDLQSQMSGQGEHIQQIGQAVQKLLEQHQLAKREVRPGDSLSIRNDGERQLVRQLVDRYRAVSEEERLKLPALLNAIGKLEVVAGDFEAAQKDFQQVAILAQDQSAQSEAHFNAYRVALERREFDTAMKEFIEAVKLDAKRFAPFPVGKYHPKRILGAGGFGVAFLCRHKYMNADVVVKTLQMEALGRETDTVFTEAQALRQLDHPAIIRISECGYVDASNKSRPHIIMDYFQGQTLEEYVKEHSPLPVKDLLEVARQVAEGLQAAHGTKILHRDVKPANLLVRKETTGWKVKIIDFGLAMTQKVIQTSQKGNTSRQRQTMIGSSIAGTLDYGSPEQMGRRTEPVGPYSDVYGWAKTCCYALFQTTQPLMKHWQSIPSSLAQLLEDCLAENPGERPATFAKVLGRLTQDDDTSERSSNQDRLDDFNVMTELAPQKNNQESPPPKKRKVAKSNRLRWFIGVGVLAIALIVLAVILSSGKKTELPSPEKEIAQTPATVQPKNDPPPKKNSGLSNNPKTSPNKDIPEKTSPEPREPKQEPKKEDEPIGEVRQFTGHTGGIWAVDLSPNSRLAISGSGKEWKDGKFTDVADNTVRIWDVETGKQLHCFNKHSNYVKQVAFSPDNRKATSCSADKTVRLWDVEDGKEIHCFTGHTNQVSGVVFIPKTGNLASVGVDGSLRVWDTSTGKALNEFPLGIGELHCIAVSSDGRSAFCGTKDKSAHLVDLATGKVERSYNGQTDLLHSIAVSPDGQTLLAGSANGNAMMWSVSDGKKLGAFDGHAVRFTNDSKRILLGCNDATVRLLDRSDMREITRLRGHKAYVQGVAFSPDGRYALSGSWDGTLRLWKLPPMVESKEPPIGIWEEVRPVVVGKKTEYRNRIREFRPDGTLILRLVQTGEEISGTWRKVGGRIYFNETSTDEVQPGTKEKWFTIQEADSFVMAILMEGERRFVWNRIVAGRSPEVPPAEDATVKAMKTLEGEWLCIAMEEIGKKFDEKTVKEQNRRVTIKGHSYIMKRTKDGVYATHEGKFNIDASNGHFDFIGTDEQWVGIYELNGDTLKVCYRYKRNNDLVRPTEFKTDTEKPNISVFYTFKRIK